MNTFLRSFATIILIIFSFNNLYSHNVLLGIDVLEKQNFSILKGKRVGLITNQTGVNSKLQKTIDILKNEKSFKLVSVFAPEHGVKGLVGAGQLFESFFDSTDGIMYYALYGKTNKPTKQMLSDIDVLVYDIQDIGVRSYTYISTLGLAMEAAAENNIEFIVLDRPNPLGGIKIEGNVVEEGFKSFVSQFEIPYVYGLTCGELATILNEKKSIGNKSKCKLTVIKMKGWRRWMKFSDTGLLWVPTSPNVPQKETPFYLVATGVLGELLVFNIGISYTLSFEVIAQEWINADTLAKKMNDLKLKGVLFRPISFKPNFGDLKDKIMNGIQIHITDFNNVNLLELQFYFMQVHNQLYPEKNPFELCSSSRINMFDKVMGTDRIRKEFSKRFLVEDIKPILDKDINWFRELSKRYYLYN
ncbi:MAG: DUF1343 domain-containing protein [Melioribacteraceae bacterium]|nr:DUF1343 domain-containing protein [Melioribacteraceae bacterium]